MSASIGSFDLDIGADFFTEGTYLSQVMQLSNDDDIEFVNAAGEDGQGSKNYGFRQVRIKVVALIVGEDFDDVQSVIAEASESLRVEAPFDATISSVSYKDCFIEPGSFEAVGPCMQSGGGTAYQYVQMIVKCVSLD